MTNKNILIKPDLTTHVTRLKNFWCSRRITKKFWFYNWLLLLIGNRKVEKKIGLCYMAKSDLKRWIFVIFFKCVFQICHELMMQKVADRWAAQLFNKEKLWGLQSCSLTQKLHPFKHKCSNWLNSSMN